MQAYEQTADDVTFEDQLNSDHEGPVVLVSLYTVPPGQMDAFIEAWTRRARLMRSQPGNLGGQMHRGIAGANVLVNYVTWESVAAYRNAMKAAQDDGFFVEGLTVRPVLVEKIQMPVAESNS